MDSIQADVIALIAKQRCRRLVEGGRFIKYSTKGQKTKDKYWLCKLSPNCKTLHYGDLDDNKDKTLDELPNRLNVSDIKRIIVGKECPHMKDSYIKKTNVDLAFTIVYASDQEGFLNFVAFDQKTFNNWTDGLNALLEEPMFSEAFQRDLQILTEIQIKMRSLSSIKSD